MRLILAGLISFWIVLVASSAAACAEDMPPHWPWHGVSIENSDYSPEQLKAVATALKINFVQLRLRPRKLAHLQGYSPQEAWAKSLAWGDRMLDQCRSLGLVAMMTVEGFPIDPATPYDQTSPDFWRNAQNLNEVITLAGQLAEHFAGRGGELIGYQLLSEPVIIIGKKSVAPPHWGQLAERIIAAIRSHDRDRWIAIAPGPWGLPGGYSDFKPLKHGHIIYGAHMYLPHAFTHQGIRQYTTRYSYPGTIDGKEWNKNALKTSMQPLRDFQEKYRVPVWIGEFSAVRWTKGGEQYIEDLASIFNDYGWSWTYFSINGWQGWSPDYDQRYGMTSKEAAAQKVGFDSVRWATLRKIFGDLKR